MCIAPLTALSAGQARWVVSPAVGGVCVSLRRIAERHKDVTPAGVEGNASAGHCAAANGITNQLGRADPALWPLHSRLNAGAGESGYRAYYIKEHGDMVLHKYHTR